MILALGRNTGTILMLFAGIHLLVSFILFGAPLREILRAGPGAGLTWSFEMLSAFWFLIFTWPLFLLGYVVRWGYRRTGVVPAGGTLGWGLVLVPALSVVFLPVSGLWLFIPAGVLVLIARHRLKGAPQR